MMVNSREAPAPVLWLEGALICVNVCVGVGVWGDVLPSDCKFATVNSMRYVEICEGTGNLLLATIPHSHTQGQTAPLWLCHFNCSEMVNLPAQAVGRFPLGWGLVVKDKPSELCAFYYDPWLYLCVRELWLQLWSKQFSVVLLVILVCACFVR